METGRGPRNLSQGAIRMVGISASGGELARPVSRLRAVLATARRTQIRVHVAPPRKFGQGHRRDYRRWQADRCTCAQAGLPASALPGCGGPSKTFPSTFRRVRRFYKAPRTSRCPGRSGEDSRRRLNRLPRCLHSAKRPRDYCLRDRWETMFWFASIVLVKMVLLRWRGAVRPRAPSKSAAELRHHLDDRPISDLLTELGTREVEAQAILDIEGQSKLSHFSNSLNSLREAATERKRAAVEQSRDFTLVLFPQVTQIFRPQQRSYNSHA